MSDAIKDLISQILDKDFVGANSTFESLLGEKIQDHLDEEEMKIAAKIYNDIDYDEVMAEEADHDDDEEDWDDEDEEDADDLDEENLSELSKKTLSSYAKKANVSGIAATATMMASKSGSPDQKKYSKIAGKRIQGVHRAVDRMAKEETEIQELSKKTLASYIGSASIDKSYAAHDTGKINQKAATTGTTARDRAEREQLSKRHGKRSLGIQRAANKLAKD